MAPLTEHTPKPLIQVAGEALIVRLIRTFHGAGIDAFTVGTGWMDEALREHLSHVVGYGSIDTVPVSDYEYGPLKTLVTALEYIDDETVLISPSDLVITGAAVAAAIKDHEDGPEHRKLTIVVGGRGDHGVPVFGDDGGAADGIGMPVHDSREVGRCMMLLIADPGFLDHCLTAINSGETRVVSVVNRMIALGEPVRYFLHDSPWFDIDDVSQLIGALAHMLETAIHTPGTVFVPRGDVVDVGRNLTLASGIRIGPGTRLVGPVFLGTDTRIDGGSQIGPNVSMDAGSGVGKECTVHDCLLFGGGQLQDHTSLSHAVVSANGIYR